MELGPLPSSKSNPVRDVILASATCARMTGPRGNETRNHTIGSSFVVATLGDRKSPGFDMTRGLPRENLSAEYLGFLRLLRYAAFDVGSIRNASQERMRSVREQMRSTYVSTVRSTIHILRPRQSDIEKNHWGMLGRHLIACDEIASIIKGFSTEVDSLSPGSLVYGSLVAENHHALTDVVHQTRRPAYHNRAFP